MGMATETTWLVLAIAVAVLNCGAGTCTALRTSTAGEHGVSGFPSLDEIRGNGSLLVDTTTHTNESSQVLFPDINFTCDGRLTKLTFVALRGDVRSVDSILNLFMESSTVDNEYNGRRIHNFNAAIATPIPGTATGYELQFENGVPFMAGHVLGIQSQVSGSKYHFLYQLGEEITVCRRVSSPSQFFCTLESEFGQPLVAVEAYPPECASGFMDIDALRHIMAATSITTYPTSLSDQRYSRLLYFNCRSNLKKWTVGARINEDETTAPYTHSRTVHIHIRTPEQDSYIIPNGTRHLSSLNATSYLNVYEYELSPTVDVWTRRYIALEFEANPKIQIYYERYGLSTTVDRPLIAADAECFSECGNCTSGFMSVDELREKARFIPNFADVEDVFLPFPHMNITQDGYLVKWTFTAEDLGEDNDRTEYPDLYILRLPTGDTDYMEYEYENVESWMMDHTDGVIVYLNGSLSVSTNYPNVYEYTVEPPMPVQAGDFIAIYQPPDDNARLLLSFVHCPAPETIHLEKRDDHEDYEQHSVWEEHPIQPLVFLQLDISNSQTPTHSVQATIPTKVLSPTLTPTPTTERDGAPSDGKDTPNNGALIGGVLSVVSVAILAAILVVVVVLILLRRRHKKTGNGSIDNPVYAQGAPGSVGSVASAHPKMTTASEYAELSDYRVYAEPSTTTATATTRDHNGHTATSNLTSVSPQPPPPPHSQYSEVSQEYAVPDAATPVGRKTAVSNPDYFYTEPHMNGNGSLVPDQNHYDFAIYVPTKEQREQLTEQNQVYSTLEEVQVGEKRGSLTFFEECDTYWKPAPNRECLYSQLAHRKYREIPRHQIQVTEHLGSGQFGTVNRGVWQGPAGVEVAVKMLQAGTSEEDTVRFLQEAAINGQFKHPNIVQLIGVVTVGNPVMIVTELVHKGDLRTYLLSKYNSESPGELPPSDMAAMLCQFCMQVAQGMDYLSRKAFVHRDLAARNILVTQHKTCKISDFGMSRDLDEGSYYVSHGGKIPVKWTAPEALHLKKYSTASDVWSFGCLMYEIWSLGHKPFEGYSNQDTIELIDRGCRLAPPPGCPQEMYRLMITCWNSDKSARTQFGEIVETLTRPEHELLSIPEEVKGQAALLGAPLEAGRDLYTELQNTYIT